MQPTTTYLQQANSMCRSISLFSLRAIVRDPKNRWISHDCRYLDIDDLEYIWIVDGWFTLQSHYVWERKKWWSVLTQIHIYSNYAIMNKRSDVITCLIDVSTFHFHIPWWSKTIYAASCEWERHQTKTHPICSSSRRLLSLITSTFNIFLCCCSRKLDLMAKREIQQFMRLWDISCRA